MKRSSENSKTFKALIILACLTTVLCGTIIFMLRNGENEHGAEENESEVSVTEGLKANATEIPQPTETPTVTPTNSPTPSPSDTPTVTPTPIILLDVDQMTEEGLNDGVKILASRVIEEENINPNEGRNAVRLLWQWVEKNIAKGKDQFPEDEKKSAYSGFMDRKGGTVTKNAVFGALVDALGLKHMRVSTADKSHEHTWNLCCIEDEWYHFDYFVPKGGHYVCFMQTDEQVRIMTCSLYPYYHYYDLNGDLPERATENVFNGYMETWMGERKEIVPEEEILAKLAELEEQYPSGKYWNHGGVSDIPCDHKASIKTCNRYDSICDRVYVHGSIGDQCRGFADLLSDAIFGKDAGVNTFSDYDDLKVGDLFRIMYVSGTTRQNCHSAMIIEKNDDYVLVAEANYDYNTCRIRWRGKYTRKYLESCGTWYISRE
ncbi:MAG: hypothetical protein K6G60_07405 [Lachnospiraceae bacterium]|nr:hypothetical protein [Lachnospiraceae bacterium]